MVIVPPIAKALTAVNTMETTDAVAWFPTASAAANVRVVPIVIRPPSAGMFPLLGVCLLVDTVKTSLLAGLGEALGPEQLQVSVDPELTMFCGSAVKPVVVVVVTVKFPEVVLTEQNGFAVKIADPKDTLIKSSFTVVGRAKLYVEAVTKVPAKVTLA